MATDIWQTCEAAFANGFTKETLAQCPGATEIIGGLAGGAIAAIVLASIAIALVLIVAIYVYYSITWYTIAKKLNHKKPWLAWIPIVNIALVLQLGGFHWAWIFLILIPVIGWIALFIIGIIAKWFIYEKRNYPGWLSLAIIIPKIGWILYFITIGFVAWGDRPGRRPLPKRAIPTKTIVKKAPVKAAKKPVKKAKAKSKKK